MEFSRLYPLRFYALSGLLACFPFSAESGAHILDRANLHVKVERPSPVLTDFEYYGELVVPGKGGILEKEIAATEAIKIPYAQRIQFAIRFANLDSRSLNRSHFRYILEGHEYDWQLSGADRRASYANLAPGTYQFKVQSSPDGRNWSEETAEVEILITLPWWQTWWAKTLAITALIFVTVAVTENTIKTRIKQISRREEQLTTQRDRAEAALTRQLQNRMLLERTAKELSLDSRGEHILSDALLPILSRFGATHCLVQRLAVEAATDGTDASTLIQIGYCCKLPQARNRSKPTLRFDNTLTQRILESESAISILDRHSIPDSIKTAFAPDQALSLLAARTRFLDSTNGLVVLLRVGGSPTWDEDDIKLLEALRGPFGISIAQINAAATEEKYRIHLEEARHRADVANRAKSDFLAKMTHELRTPLNAIIGFSRILEEDKSLKVNQRETLDIINNSGEHLLGVINDILDLSKIEAGKMEKNEETFELLPLLKSVYEMLAMRAQSQGISFHFAAHSDLPAEITTDLSKLRQVLINLIGNAIKFTAVGGVGVAISSTERSPAARVMGRMRRAIQLHFEISDTGQGISEEEIGKLFEHYSQTESGRRASEGTGLGLPIARSIIQILGGDIAVESVPGKGTSFRFSIECDELWPMENDRLPPSTALDEKTAQRINGFISRFGEIRILIAEDQFTNRLLLKRILAKAGFTLAEVENGQAAVDKWNEWKPHLILMDEDMPLKRGSEATREIKSRATLDDDPVIVSLTAYAMEQAKISAIEAGCSDFVAKPFRPHELFSVISKHLQIAYTFNDAA